MTYKKHQKVSWEWGSSTAAGTITQIYTSEMTETIKGSEITGNISDGQPAYLIEQNDGDKVLKSHSEVSVS